MAQIPQWFVDAALVLILGFGFVFLIKIICGIIGAELPHFLEALKSEIEDSKEGKTSVGSLNWKGFWVVSLLGVISVVSLSTQKAIGAVLDFFGSERGAKLLESTNYWNLMWFSGCVLIASLIAVVIDNRRK